MQPLQIRRRDMCFWKAHKVRQNSLPIRVSFLPKPTDSVWCNSLPLTPFSYVQMLERSHAQLTAGLQELYRRTQNCDGWTGPRLELENPEQPLTHQILEALGVLRTEDWEDPESIDESRQALEGYGLDNNEWMYPESASPSTQVTFFPDSPSQTAFPYSEIMSKRRSKLLTTLPLVTPTSTISPHLTTTFASTKAEPYKQAFSTQTAAPLDAFTSKDSMFVNLDRAAGSMMDWSFGIDDTFANVGGQEHSIEGR